MRPRHNCESRNSVRGATQQSRITPHLDHPRDRHYLSRIQREREKLARFMAKSQRVRRRRRRHVMTVRQTDSAPVTERGARHAVIKLIPVHLVRSLARSLAPSRAYKATTARFCRIYIYIHDRDIRELVNEIPPNYLPRRRPSRVLHYAFNCDVAHHKRREMLIDSGDGVCCTLHQ